MKTKIFCAFVLAISFASFAKSLDRYPLYFIDEPFYNYPSIHYLDGGGLTYRTTSRAPHADTIVAYHSPLFPWVQVVTFKYIGISEFACRLPEYLAAHLGLLTLCLFLSGRGLGKSAMVLAVAWVGDRALLEVLTGRMDGIVLFLLALGFVGLVKTLEGGSVRWGMACGLFLGFAAGFHPMAVLFPAVAVGLLGMRLPTDRRAGVVLGFVAAGLIPLALVLWCWSSDLWGALEQFRWAARFQKDSHAEHDLGKLLDLLRWSRYWFIALVATVVLYLVPVSVRGMITGGPAATREDHRSLRASAVGFSVAGLFCILLSVKFPYYLIYFSTWAVMGLCIAVETMPPGRRVRSAGGVFLAMLALAWVPSFLWNALRFRESVLYYRTLDQARFAGRLSAMIPGGVKVMGSPPLFIIARNARLDFTPLAWFDEPTEVAPETWLLLTEEDWLKANRVRSSDQASRSLVYRGPAFPEASGGWFDYPIVILGPVASPSHPAPDQRPRSADGRQQRVEGRGA